MARTCVIKLSRPIYSVTFDALRDTQFLFDSVFGHLESFHITENEKLFAKRISLVGVFLLESFLKNGDLHLLLIDLVAKKDNLFVFLIASILESRFRLRLRTLPENRAARRAALMIRATAALTISRLLVIIYIWSLNDEKYESRTTL